MKQDSGQSGGNGRSGLVLEGLVAGARGDLAPGFEQGLEHLDCVPGVPGVAVGKRLQQLPEDEIVESVQVAGDLPPAAWSRADRSSVTMRMAWLMRPVIVSRSPATAAAAASWRSEMVFS